MKEVLIAGTIVCAGGFLILIVIASVLACMRGGIDDRRSGRDGY